MSTIQYLIETNYCSEECQSSTPVIIFTDKNQAIEYVEYMDLFFSVLQDKKSSSYDKSVALQQILILDPEYGENSIYYDCSYSYKEIGCISGDKISVIDVDSDFINTLVINREKCLEELKTKKKLELEEFERATYERLKIKFG